jgi:acetyltransferase-like isoleucine patch superfamily enzyme
MLNKEKINNFLVIIEHHLKQSVKRIMRFNLSDPSHQNLYSGVSISDYSKVVIGERVSFGGQVRIFNTSFVRIGNDCMIAYGVQIITPTHDYENNPIWKQRVDRPVEIGNHVWIGTNAIILPGVRIGDYAVIGAGAVISAHVPERAVVVGNPARIVKIREISAFDDNCVFPGVAIEKGFLSDTKVTKNNEK